MLPPPPVLWLDFPGIILPPQTTELIFSIPDREESKHLADDLLHRRFRSQRLVTVMKPFFENPVVIYRCPSLPRCADNTQPAVCPSWISRAFHVWEGKPFPPLRTPLEDRPQAQGTVRASNGLQIQKSKNSTFGVLGGREKAQGCRKLLFFPKADPFFKMWPFCMAIFPVDLSVDGRNLLKDRPADLHFNSLLLHRPPTHPPTAGALNAQITHRISHACHRRRTHREGGMPLRILLHYCTFFFTCLYNPCTMQQN